MHDSSKGFCSADNFSVLIPYKDLEALLKIVRNYDTLLNKVQRMEKQLEALRSMYSEALDRIAEISRYL